MAAIETRPEIETLTAVIAHSPIVVAQQHAVLAKRAFMTQAAARRHLPDGFEEVDVAILDWIVAEALLGRTLN